MGDAAILMHKELDQWGKTTTTLFSVGIDAHMLAKPNMILTTI